MQEKDTEDVSKPEQRKKWDRKKKIEIEDNYASSGMKGTRKHLGAVELNREKQEKGAMRSVFEKEPVHKKYRDMKQERRVQAAKRGEKDRREKERKEVEKDMWQDILRVKEKERKVDNVEERGKKKEEDTEETVKVEKEKMEIEKEKKDENRMI